MIYYCVNCKSDLTRQHTGMNTYIFNKKTKEHYCGVACVGEHLLNANKLERISYKKVKP